MDFQKIVDSFKKADRYGKMDIVYNFAGPRNVDIRQEFMMFLTNEKRPKAKCGIHAIEKELNNKCGE